MLRLRISKVDMPKMYEWREWSKDEWSMRILRGRFMAVNALPAWALYYYVQYVRISKA